MLRVWIFLIYLNIVVAFKYLLVNPIWAFSHIKFNSQIADVLANEGHNVTMFNFHHIHVPNIDNLVRNRNVNIINYYPDNFEKLKNLPKETFPELWDSKLITNMFLAYFYVPSMLTGKWRNTYSKLLRDQEILNSLKGENFDAVITETFELGGFYISHLINVPSVIATMSAVRYPYTEQLFGQPYTLGYLPGDFSMMGKEATVWDRLNDIYTNFMFTNLHRRISDMQYRLFNSLVDFELPHWEDLIRNSTFFITNSNSYLDFAIPKTANIIPIGGFTFDKKNQPKLPEEYEKLMGETTVVISYGSIVRSFEMPEEFKTGLIGLFNAFPNVTFIWKYEKDDEEFKKRLGPNVHLKSWMPQSALLGDERVKLFITHGGLASTMEVAYIGKPALVVPLFSDQFQNSQMLARHGGALVYDKYELGNSAKLQSVFRELFENPRIAENAKFLATVLHNQPVDQKRVLIKHMEFAAKFPKMQSLVPENSHNNFVAFYYLDAIFCCFVLSFLILFVVPFLTIKVRCQKRNIIVSDRKL